MKTIATTLGIAVTGGVLSACSFFSMQPYCVEEREANGLDYMIVTDMAVCDNPNADAEYYSTNEFLNYGDVAYVESDGSHSVKNKRKPEEIKKVTTAPPYKPATPQPVIPAPTKICLKAYSVAGPVVPKPAPPATPKNAPVAPKTQQAPVVKAPAPTAATIKPGC